MAYNSYIVGSIGEILGLVVSESNYHTFVNKDLGFEVNTSCNARNEWSITIYLCPLGTACL